MSTGTQQIYSGEQQEVLRTYEQHVSAVPAGTQVRLRDLSFDGCEPVYIANGLRYGVRRMAAGWETTGERL